MEEPRADPRLTAPTTDLEAHDRDRRIPHTLWEDDDDLDVAYRASRRPTVALLALPTEPWDDIRRAMIQTKRRTVVRRRRCSRCAVCAGWRTRSTTYCCLGQCPWPRRLTEYKA